MTPPSGSAPDTDSRPNQDGRNRDERPNRAPLPGAGGEPRGVQHDIADADKKARTGKRDESVRNSPPFGEFDDVGK